jgi:pimeloyl-ACP methyl ester carboxylesterase
MSKIVLIPGLLSDGYVWEPLQALLADRAFGVDLTTQDNITQMALDCLALDPGVLRVAGHSMGARVAMEMARLAPDRVERLALLDTGIHPLAEGEPAKREAVIRRAHDEGMDALAADWLPGMVWSENLENAALMAGLRAMVLRQDADIHERQIRSLMGRPDAASYLAEITCPTLLMVGRQDKWSPIAQHETMLDLLPDAQLEIIEDAGHFAPVEQPEAVARVLAAFLQN